MPAAPQTDRYQGVDAPYTAFKHLNSPPSLTGTSFESSDISDDTVARTLLLTPMSTMQRDYGASSSGTNHVPFLTKTIESSFGLESAEPQTPTKLSWAQQESVLPASAPATPSGSKEKRKSKRFSIFGRERSTPAEVIDDVPALPAWAKQETEKRKTNRLSISRSLQNLQERARADRASRRASFTTNKRVPDLGSDLPPVPSIPSMYKTTSKTMATEIPAPRNRRTEKGIDHMQEEDVPKVSGFKKFVRRMTLQKPPKLYPSDPASTSVPARPKTPVGRPKTPVGRPKTPVDRPKTPTARSKTPVDRPETPVPPMQKSSTINHSPTPSGRFGSLGRSRSKKRNSVPHCEPPKSVKGVLAEMSQSSAAVQRRATQRRSQIQRIPVPSAYRDEDEPLITGDEKPAPPQVEVDATEKPVAEARADALARLLGTKAAPSPSEADLKALPPLNLPLTGVMIGSTTGHTHVADRIDDTLDATPSTRPRAPVPPLRTNSPRSMATAQMAKPDHTVPPPPEAMDVFYQPRSGPSLPTSVAAAAYHTKSPSNASSQQGQKQRVFSPYQAAPGSFQAAPTSYRSPHGDLASPVTSAGSHSMAGGAHRYTGSRDLPRSESPQALCSLAGHGDPYTATSRSHPLPPGAAPAVSEGAIMTDAAALAASYRMIATMPPDSTHPACSVARNTSLPARKPIGPVRGLGTTGYAMFNKSRSDLGHGATTPEEYRWPLASDIGAPVAPRHREQPRTMRSATGPAAFGASRSDLGHGATMPDEYKWPVAGGSAAGFISPGRSPLMPRTTQPSAGPSAFGKSRSDLGHGASMADADDHGWPTTSASDSGHRTLHHARSQPALRHSPSHPTLQVPPALSKSSLRYASSSSAMRDAAILHQAALYENIRNGRNAVSDLGHGEPPAMSSLKSFNKSATGYGFLSAHGHGSDDEFDDWDSAIGHGSSIGHGSAFEHNSIHGHSSIGHSTGFTHDHAPTTAFPASPRSRGPRRTGSPALYQVPSRDGMSSDGHGKPSRFRSISRKLSGKNLPPPAMSDFEIYEAKQRELASRRRSRNPPIHSQASIAAGITTVGDKEDARVMEACFMS